MPETGRWLTIEERDNRTIVSAQINPRDLADADMPAVAEEITSQMRRLPAGRPVVLAGNWPLWAIARAARLAHPQATWIGVQEKTGAVIVVAAGQEGGQPVTLASVYEGAYTGDGPCSLNFRQTSTRGEYRLDIVHPTPGRPIDGHTTVDLNSVRTAIEELRPPSDLRGVMITGHAWRVVVAMLANSSALRPAKWCAVDEPRREYAVMSWGTHTGKGKERPGTLIPRDDLRPRVDTDAVVPFPKRLWHRWRGLPIEQRVAIICAMIALCGVIYATTLPLLVNRPKPTPTATMTPTITSTPTATLTLTPTPQPTATVTPP